MDRIVESAAASRLTQAEFAARVGVTQPRLNALLRGRTEQFSLDALVNLATRSGLDVELTAGDGAAPKLPAADRATGAGDRSATPPDPTGGLTPAALAALPLFASLPPAELRRATRLFAVRSYPKGGVVVAEGDDPEHFHFILSGHVQPRWRDEAGHQLNLGVDGPGDHFADATLGGEPVLASFVAATDLRVAAIRMTDFRRLLQRHPRLAIVLLMDVVARFRRLLQRTRTLTMEGVYGRVVKLLLARAVEIDGKLVTERLTHIEIGYRVGATREMVGRLLRDLARGGYIRAERGRITILRTPPRRW
jgi:CRP/FNR family cyclic AMP-dependent transcriptional regulator